LAVVVQLNSAGAAQLPEVVLERLQLAASFLRSQIAASITRKHVPELTFRWYAGKEGTA
jgi:ribosome-binding factor A